jgi:hypothetical protein
VNNVSDVPYKIKGGPDGPISRPRFLRKSSGQFAEIASLCSHSQHLPAPCNPFVPQSSWTVPSSPVQGMIDLLAEFNATVAGVGGGPWYPFNLSFA